MKIKLKVSKMGDKKMVNIPLVLCDSFEIGEEVYLEKVEKSE